MCGFDHESFHGLESRFKDLFYTYKPMSSGSFYIKHVNPKNAKKGRPRHLCSISCLALYLAWTRTRGKQSILGLIFGLTAHQVSLWVRFSRRLLLKCLKNDDHSAIQMPSLEEINNFKHSISLKYPNLTNVCGAMDGLKAVESYDDQHVCFCNH